jgi:hypothetical protein
VETITISNSILQAIATDAGGPIAASDVKDPERLKTRLFDATRAQNTDLVAARLLALEPALLAALGAAGSPPSLPLPPSPAVPPALVDTLNQLLGGGSIYDAAAFAGIPLSAATQRLLLPASPPAAPAALNRVLLDDAFPLEFADCALGFGDGAVSLSRCTVLGRIVVHQLDASECILWDLAQVDNTQAGCVRFSAWADGSILPRKFESVRIRQRTPLFTSTDFGQPGYCQLTPTADDAILPETGPATGPPNTISAGTTDGSEMGAFARDKNPIKERGLFIKYQEFMPAGLVPVVIHVT